MVPLSPFLVLWDIKVLLLSMILLQDLSLWKLVVKSVLPVTMAMTLIGWCVNIVLLDPYVWVVPLQILLQINLFIEVMNVPPVITVRMVLMMSLLARQVHTAMQLVL
jgi:hypothetical protein